MPPSGERTHWRKSSAGSWPIIPWRRCRSASSGPFGDQIEFLLNPGAATTASGRLAARTGPVFHAQQRAKSSSPFDRFKAITGLQKIIQIDKGKATVLFEATGEEQENTDWLGEFANNSRSLGDTLGFGACEKWTIDTERYQVVGLAHDEGFIILTRRRDAFQEDLDAAVNAVLD